MRSILFPLFLSTSTPLRTILVSAHRLAPPLTSISTGTAYFPALDYPVCRRNFTCSAPWKQDFHAVMAGLAESQSAGVEKMQEPASTEQEILNGNPCEQGATKGMETKKKEEDGKTLPALSAAEFQAYNSMAEHMEYFVSFLAGRSI